MRRGKNGAGEWPLCGATITHKRDKSTMPLANWFTPVRLAGQSVGGNGSDVDVSGKGGIVLNEGETHFRLVAHQALDTVAGGVAIIDDAHLQKAA